jgi:hypothetical protein
MNIVTKGSNDVDINLEEIRGLLLSLKPYRNTQIRDLKGQQAENFKKLVDYIATSYETPVYNDIHYLITDVFQDVINEGDIEPGSVGAFYFGCTLQTNFRGNASCTPICSASVSPGKDVPGWNSCNEVTMLYYPESSSFAAINQLPEGKRENAYIFIRAGNKFESFSQEEAQQLKNYGIENVKLVYYDAGGTSYTDITPDFVNLDTITRYDGVRKVQNSSLVQRSNGTTGSGITPANTSSQTDPLNPSNIFTTENNSYFGIGLFIIIVIIIILFLVLLWRYFANRG